LPRAFVDIFGCATLVQDSRLEESTGPVAQAAVPTSCSEPHADMRLTVCYVLITFLLSLASATDKAYIGLTLGSRTVTLANLTNSGNVSIIAQLPVNKAYISWFEEAVNLKPSYE